MANDSNADAVVEINAMGQPCPMPLLMLKREMKCSPTCKIFLLKSSDPHSQIDVQRYCKMHQLRCQFTQITTQEFHYLIQS